MGLSPLQSVVARALDDVIAPHGLRRRGQVWRREDTTVRLLVRQSASLRDALVRFTLETTRGAKAPVDDRIWFQLTDVERRRITEYQLRVLARAGQGTEDPEVLAIASTLAAMTHEADEMVENWFVAAAPEDAKEWAHLLAPALDRTLRER